MSGVLTVAAVPIGNAGDASSRLKEALVTADIVACEDTRKLQRLLADLAISTTARFVSYHDVNEYKQAPKLLAALQDGKQVVLVSDAGTPLISDPGFDLVRAAIANQIPVRALPGPNAAIAALTISGLPPDRFVFEGFLPKKPGARLTRLTELALDPRTIVIYETSRNLGRSLEELGSTFGLNRNAFIARELTKVHEELFRGTLGELVESIGGRQLKGELVLVIEGDTRKQRKIRTKI